MCNLFSLFLLQTTLIGYQNIMVNTIENYTSIWTLIVLNYNIFIPYVVVFSTVNVTLDNVENPYVTIREQKLRDAQCEFPDGDKVTCYTAVKGSPGFSSGQHYWEVSMTTPNVGTKQSWWLGVTSASSIPQSDLIPSTSDGYWFLCSSRDCFQFNTEPKVSIPPCFRPLTVGVHLNYDSGEISFYNVEEKTLIGKLTATFEGEVFPLFNTGKYDKSVMEIKHRQKDQNNTENTGERIV